MDEATTTTTTSDTSNEKTLRESESLEVLFITSTFNCVFAKNARRGHVSENRFSKVSWLVGELLVHTCRSSCNYLLIFIKFSPRFRGWLVDN